ncbi:MAG: hypothetical protein ABFD50_02570 [Smithella sp.]
MPAGRVASSSRFLSSPFFTTQKKACLIMQNFFNLDNFEKFFGIDRFQNNIFKIRKLANLLHEQSVAVKPAGKCDAEKELYLSADSRRN